MTGPLWIEDDKDSRTRTSVRNQSIAIAPMVACANPVDSPARDLWRDGGLVSDHSIRWRDGSHLAEDQGKGWGDSPEWFGWQRVSQYIRHQN